MPHTEWFKEWFNSPYYHKLYCRHDDDEALEFIGKLLSFLAPAQNALMVDVACGKGRHSRVLASHGYDVTGIDLSPNSIAEAKKHESENLHFFVHDMRLPFWINYFDYAFNFYTSFGYFNTKREHENALRTIVQSLKPNGIFILDYLNIIYAADHFIPSFDVDKEGVQFHITKWFDETSFYKKIVVADKALNEPAIFNEKIAKFSLEDISEMLANKQMQVQQVFGDYSLNQYDKTTSPRMIVVAKKV